MTSHRLTLPRPVTSNDIANPLAAPWTSLAGGLALAGVAMGLLGAILSWRWPMLTAVLILLTGLTVMTIWQWHHDRTVGGRVVAAVTSLALVAGWLVTVWLVEFPTVMARLTLTLAGSGVIVVACTSVHRRTSRCVSVPVDFAPPPAQTILDTTESPTTGGDQR